VRAEHKRLDDEDRGVVVRKNAELDHEHDSSFDRDRGQVTEEAAMAPADPLQQAKKEPPPAQKYGLLIELLGAIFRRDLNVLDGVCGLSLREQQALEFLVTAVEGRDTQLDHFVDADDRRIFLEQGLAALYPILAIGLDPAMAPLRAIHDHVVDEVVHLRANLVKLAEAQTDFGHRQPTLHASTTPEEEGDEDEDDDEDEGNHLARPSTVYDPLEIDVVPTPSTRRP
jgi:hypothetical protein